jgi:pimeloyl-ACP methyl ester carboxylesterase
MSPLPPVLTAWRARGRSIRIFGREVFVLVDGPDDDEEPILVLHGFPTSSLDFRHALPRLAARRRVVLHDHVGFGLSEKPTDFSYSLFEQAEIALELWRSLGIKRGHLVAHDYGTSVATEILTRRNRKMCPIDFASVTLSNGSVLLELAHLTPSQRLLRSPRLGPIFAALSSRLVFRAQLARVLGSPDSVASEELDLMWSSIVTGGGKRVLPAISSYLDERVRHRARWVGALSSLDVPAHVLWGRLDPVAVSAIADALAATIPGARLSWLDELGHYPMLEGPERWAGAAIEFIDSLGTNGR